MTVADFRAQFMTDFDEIDDAPIELALASAAREYALDDEAVLWLAAHVLAVNLTDRNAVDSGAGVVVESGTGELRSVLSVGDLTPRDREYLRDRYGRRYVELRRVATAL